MGGYVTDPRSYSQSRVRKREWEGGRSSMPTSALTVPLELGRLLKGLSYLRKMPLRLGVESKAWAGTELILLFCRYRYSSDSGRPSGISVS